MEDRNQAVVLIRVGVNKKVGRPNFSSYEASLHVEMAVNIGALADNQFHDFVMDKYRAITEEVNGQIAAEIAGDPFNKTAPKPAAQIAQAPVQQPVAAKSFADYLRARSAELNIKAETIARHLYKVLVDGPHTEKQEVFNVLNNMWKSGSLTEAEADKRMLSCPTF